MGFWWNGSWPVTLYFLLLIALLWTTRRRLEAINQLDGKHNWVPKAIRQRQFNYLDVVDGEVRSFRFIYASEESNIKFKLVPFANFVLKNSPRVPKTRDFFLEKTWEIKEGPLEWIFCGRNLFLLFIVVRCVTFEARRQGYYAMRFVRKSHLNEYVAYYIIAALDVFLPPYKRVHSSLGNRRDGRSLQQT